MAQPRTEENRSLQEGTREATILIERGEYLLAIEHLNRLIDSAAPGDNFSSPLFLLTEANAEVDRNYPALDAARRFLLLYPNDPRAGEVMYRRGITAWRENNRAEARNSFAEIIRLKGDREDEAYYWLARMAAEEDSLNLAEKLADRSLEDNPHEFTDDALYLSAWIKEGRGEYQEAGELYRQLVENYPESDLALDAQLRLGVNQARGGYHESALTLFSSLTPRTDRQREELLFYEAESNAALGRHEKAINLYTEFLRTFPQSERVRSVRYGLGWSELQSHRYTNAIATFQTLTKGNDSLAAAALYQIGAIQVTRGDTAAAMASLHELVWRLPYESFSDNAYNVLGRIHYRRRNYDSARRYLMITARQFPESDVRIEAFHLLGESYAALRQFDNAQYSFSRVVKLGDSTDPLVSHALYREGVMLYYVGRFNSAIDRLRTYVSHYPDGEDIDEATFWLAEALYQDGTIDEAEKFYSEVVGNWPKSRYRAEAMYGVAWTEFRQKKFRESITSFQKFIDTYPDDDNVVEAIIRMADAYRFLREYDKAIATYESVGGKAGSGTRAEEARVRLAEAFVEMRDYPRAVETYRDLVKRYPKSNRVDDYAYAIGATWYRGGNDSLTIIELERFLREYPESEYRPNAYFTLGDAWYNLGEYETALGWYRMVLDQYPNSPIVVDAIEGLRYALESMERGPEAVEIISTFVEQNPSRLAADSITFKKGVIWFDNGEYAKADSIFRKLIADYPESPLVADAWYQVGKGMEYSGDVSEAIATYEKVVSTYSSSNAALLSLIAMAELRMFEEDYEKARGDFLLFTQRFGESEYINQARYGAGKASLVLGDTLTAIEQFRLIIDSLASEDGTDLFVDRSRISLSEIYWMQDSTDLALEVLASVTSRRRDYAAAEALLLRGKILRSVNDLSGALADLRRLTEEFTDYPEYTEPGLLELGSLYEELTNTAEAITTYQLLIDTTEDETLRKEAEARIAQLKRRR
ncbi:MAG: tetratricopeptide repeat protein [Candidatus Kapaibacterium sp.]